MVKSAEQHCFGRQKLKKCGLFNCGIVGEGYFGLVSRCVQVCTGLDCGGILSIINIINVVVVVITTFIFILCVWVFCLLVYLCTM